MTSRETLVPGFEAAKTTQAYILNASLLQNQPVLTISFLLLT